MYVNLPENVLARSASHPPAVMLVSQLVGTCHTGGMKAGEKAVQEKIMRKTLMLQNPVTKASTALQSQAAYSKKRKRKRRQKLLSARQRRAKGLDKLPADSARYATFVPLHELWNQYMADFMREEMKRAASIDAKLLKADFHGARLEVVCSSCPNYVGVEGIVVQETQKTFVLIGSARPNEFRQIPKAPCVFMLSVLNPYRSGERYNVQIFGKHFCYRSAERSVRKYKSKNTIEL